MKSYFLSYARLDEALALRVANDLIAAGVSLWVDKYDIRPSQHWDRAVETAVRGCRGLIVILSPRSAASPNVADEVAVAIEDGKEIIPILIEACTVPLRMTRMQYLDATVDFDAAVRRCLAVIRAEEPPADPPPPPAPQPEPDAVTASLAPEVLRDAERRLAAVMGPIARVLVRKAAATAASPAELYQALAAGIANPADRRAFLADAAQAPPAPAPARPMRASPANFTSTFAEPQAITPDEIKAITGALIRHLGPIAAQLIGREKPAAASREDLCRRLGEHISAPKDRAAFLREMRAE